MDRDIRQREKEKERMFVRDFDEKDLVNQHFKESFRLASQKLTQDSLQYSSPYFGHQAHTTQQQNQAFNSQGAQWNPQALNSTLLKMDSRNQPSRSHVSQHSDSMRKLKEPEQFVHDGIYKAFRSDSLEKHPPPAHSKHHIEKPFPLYGGNEPSKLRDNSSYHDKPSVIVQPDLKVQSHSVSPKHRLPTEKAYPGATAPFKYESSSSPHRPPSSHSLTHSVHGPSIHGGLEITKSRQPTSSPHSVPLSERYYPQATKSNVSSYSNIIGMNSSHQNFKAKVSPPHVVYGKPTGAPPVKAQPVQQTPPLNAPPPAHSSSRHTDRPTIPDHRLPNPHSPYDRIQSSNSSFSRTEVPQISPQMQPLDLGTREISSDNRKRACSPLPTTEAKKSRTDSSPPVLSRVSEPSPLYFPSATTITTVENVALNLQRTSSPVSSSVSSAVSSNKPSVTVATTVQDTAVSCTNSPNKITVQTSTANIARQENNSSPLSRLSEPEKSNSPGPGGYVHKLKKAWLQRHEGDAPTSSTNGTSTPSRVATPPPKPIVKENKPPPALTPEPKNKNPIEIKPKSLNGHQKPKDADDSSSDSDTNSTSSKPKKKSKKAKKSSDSDSDKESDGSASSKKSTNKSESKKRGRKPKTKDDSKAKKVKEDPIDPLQKPPVSQLKKTGESFLQDKSCYEVAPKLPKCRECRWTPYQRNKKMPNIFCRFYAFRRLRYTKSGQLAVAGFSDPVKDAFGEDLRLWVPDHTMASPDLNLEKSKFLLTHVGDQFCDLFQQEKEAMALHMGEDTIVAWKRVVQGVREMCDVCETTLFNIHWACSKCGFVVCIDCYRGRREGTIKVWDTDDNGRDKYQWLLCASKVPHEQDKLMLTQIIAGNALTDLGHKIHEIRNENGIPMYCGCAEAAKYKEENKINGIKKEIKSEEVNGKIKEEVNGNDDEVSNSPLNFFANVALSNDKRESESSNSDSDSDDKGEPSTLRELLVRPNAKSNTASVKEEKKEPRKKAKVDALDEVFFSVIDRGVDKDNKKDPMKVELKHFIRKYNYNRKGREPLPIRIMTKTESRLLYPDVPHGWLCDGKLLRLMDPNNPLNVAVFQDQWKRGQPVVVSGVGQNLNLDLWNPSSFSRDFGEVKNNLINCLTDNIVPNQPMKKFWDGFENQGKRLKDDKGSPMVLKLKDWPPGEDFAEMLPSRFDDLMKVLPMGEYTRRNGSFNLAGRLPDCFVRPDLGPKMYIAYGSASYPGKASTNLHLDISDAVNVMCHVGIPTDVDREQCLNDTIRAIDDAGCDILTRQRVREKEELPGALWHIYNARDSDKIRDLLNKVAIERGKKLEPHHDPIHDQSWYLDGYLRERLYKEYNVEGYAIVQCMGDAVFIPAGAPHQVRNLQNCIKVAEDFVSPENVAHCFHLTQEFRHLSDTHTNHEDKLQIKNIIYHAMKDSTAVLMGENVDKDS